MRRNNLLMIRDVLRKGNNTSATMHNLKVTSMDMPYIILMVISPQELMVVLTMETVYPIETTPLCLSKRLYLIMSSLQKIMADYTGFHCLSFCRSLLYLLDALGKKACRGLKQIKLFRNCNAEKNILLFLPRGTTFFKIKKRNLQYSQVPNWQKKSWCIVVYYKAIDLCIFENGVKLERLLRSFCSCGICYYIVKVICTKLPHQRMRSRKLSLLLRHNTSRSYLLSQLMKTPAS